jgi:hypothetical protein
LDRGVVEVQLADASGAPIGNWLKIVAYENNYDQQGTDDFTNCTFDPVDDGNDEDDYFNPSDPLRRLGPSSTCFPEFVFARGGHTDWRLDFNPANTSASRRTDRASRKPGSRFSQSGDLGPAEVRPLRLSPAVASVSASSPTSIEIGASRLWDELFAVDNVVGDDGWFIDDVRIMEAVAAPIVARRGRRLVRRASLRRVQFSERGAERVAESHHFRDRVSRDAPGVGLHARCLQQRQRRSTSSGSTGT